MAILNLLPVTTSLVELPILFVLWILGLAVYRKTLHPLAKIPGPTLAAVTYLYQTYFGLVREGKFYLQVDKLHQKYGPVIRITPDEIHLSDPENYEKIYYVGSKYWKSPQYYNSLSVAYSSFGTPTNEVHAIRRSALNPLFSRKRVLELEGVVQGTVDTLIHRMTEAAVSHQPLDVHHAFRGVSIDVITDYAFDKSYNILESPDLGKKFFAMVQGLGPTMWFFQQFSFLQPLALQTPKWMAKILSAPLYQLMCLQEECVKHCQEVKDRMESGKIDPNARLTIFQHLQTPDIVEGYVVPTVLQVKDESYSVLAAAADTTGNALTVACFNVCSQPETYRKLVHELTQTFPDPNARLDFMTLEKLPYLSAIIKEALRLSFGVIGRLPRVVPAGGTTFNGVYIPGGSYVSMSSWMMHRNEDIFPDAMKFEPERWLNLEVARKLEKHLVPFGKGSRACVGMPLAYCELYVTLGRLFHRFQNLKVYHTVREDMGYNDYFSAYHPNNNPKLRVTAE